MLSYFFGISAAGSGLGLQYEITSGGLSPLSARPAAKVYQKANHPE